jgi:hypothetical protein
MTDTQMNHAKPADVHVPDVKRDHRPPDGVGTDTIAAVGKVSEAFETIERVRGHLFSFHQLMGHADAQFQEAIEMLEKAGHAEVADRIRTELVGRNVIYGRWTFQLVEEFDDTYYDVARDVDRYVRDALMEGRRHVYESEMKEAERTAGAFGHERRPDE